MKKQTLIKKLMALGLVTALSVSMAGCTSATSSDEAENVVETEEEIADEADSEEVDSEEVDSEEVDSEEAEEAVENEPAKEKTYQELYIEAIEKFQEENKDKETEYCKLAYDLIYFDDDDIPELVMGLSSYYVYMYTVMDGELVAMIDNWPYGAFGNAGYEYLEKQGTIYNSNSDMAGAEMFDTYAKWDPEAREILEINDRELYRCYIKDMDNNGSRDWVDLDMGGFTDEPTYFYGEDEVTEEEYNSHTIPGDYKFIGGEMTYEDILSKLQ